MKKNSQKLENEVKNVKILITYHSDTGNTEKVGKAMKEALDEEGQDATAIHAKEVDPSSLKSYDLVAIGSPIIGASIGKYAKALLTKVELPPKIAFFYTCQQDKAYPKAFGRAAKKIEKEGTSKVLGEFHCIGDALGMPDALREKFVGAMTPDQREAAIKHFEEIKGRPNAKDLEKAKEFAKSLIK